MGALVKRFRKRWQLTNEKVTPAFVDRVGYTWRVRLDEAAIARIKDFLDVDLSAMNTGERLVWLGDLLQNDIENTVNLLYVSILAHAEALGIDEDAFARALDSDVIEAGGFALAQAVARAEADPSLRIKVLREVVHRWGNSHGFN